MRPSALKLVIVLLAVLVSLPASGEEGGALELTLAQAVGMSLMGNLSIEQQKLLMGKAEAEVSLNEGEFDPAVELEVSRQRQRSSVISAITSAEEDSSTYGISLGGRLITGTEYDLSYSGGRTESGDTLFLLTNPYYSSEFSLSLSQPLLKGFGIGVQRSAISVAEAELDMARLESELKTTEVIAETADAYWELFFARSDLEVARLSSEYAGNLLDEVRAKIQSGAMPSFEIYNAEAEVAVREERRLKAAKAVADAEDALRAVMNHEEWNREIVPVERLPEPAVTPALDEMVDAALKNRSDYRSALKAIDARRILGDYYRNQRLPGLDLTGTAGINGLSGSSSRALDDSTSGDYYSWGIGLAFSIPIPNRTAKGNYIKAERDLEIASVEAEKARLQVLTEVREAHRSLKLALESIVATARTREAAENRLRMQEERFRLGLATLNDLMEFQEGFARAASSEIRAGADYAKALVSLKRAIGTLLP